MVEIGIKGLGEKWLQKTGLFSVKSNQLTGSYIFNGLFFMSPEALFFTLHIGFASCSEYFGISIFSHKRWRKLGHHTTWVSFAKPATIHWYVFVTCANGKVQEKRIAFISYLAMYPQQSFNILLFSGLRTSFPNIMKLKFQIRQRNVFFSHFSLTINFERFEHYIQVQCWSCPLELLITAECSFTWFFCADFCLLLKVLFI